MSHQRAGGQSSRVSDALTLIAVAVAYCLWLAWAGGCAVTEQWAQHFICAAHRSPTGVMHGHTWQVRATWASIINVEDRKTALVEACAKRCHGILQAGEGSAEGLAKSIAAELDADRVDVWREAEGLGATWRRA